MLPVVQELLEVSVSGAGGHQGAVQCVKVRKQCAPGLLHLGSDRLEVAFRADAVGCGGVDQVVDHFGGFAQKASNCETRARSAKVLGRELRMPFHSHGAGDHVVGKRKGGSGGEEGIVLQGEINHWGFEAQQVGGSAVFVQSHGGEPAHPGSQVAANIAGQVAFPLG